MNKLEYILDKYPNDKKAIVVLSGGMDSTIALQLAVKKYGFNNVKAISYFYKQKQQIELELAKKTCLDLNIEHKLVDISFLGDISKQVSANIQDGLVMPTIQDILGDPAPTTEVPNRNAILLMIAVGYAQTIGYNLVVTGLQAQDEYSYWDTTPNFINSLNDVINQNRKHNIQIFAPFQGLNKTFELQCLYELNNDFDLLKNTITCYNPNNKNESCGKCPSCAERIMAFAKAGYKDVISYSIDLDWNAIIKTYKEN